MQREKRGDWFAGNGALTSAKKKNNNKGSKPASVVFVRVATYGGLACVCLRY